MVKGSYNQKPYRKDVMRTFGATVIASPSNTTNAGRAILEKDPNTTGSLGCAISEAVEKAVTTPDCRYVLGSVLNQVLLHQSVIGLESYEALTEFGEYPDVIIGCAGGGSNLGGLIAPFMMRAYEDLHALGYAHSIEAWRDGELVGGLYGVAQIGRASCRERV